MKNHQTLVDLVTDRARSSPARGYRFVQDGTQVQDSVSYHELDRDSRRIGGRLQAEGVTPGSRVLLLFPPGLDFVRGLFGCLYAGATAVPIEPPNPRGLERTLSRLRLIAADSQPGWVLTTSGLARVAAAMTSVVPELARAQWVVISDCGPGDDEGWRPPHAGKSDLALLQYTSGSTREPHGVMLSHGNVLHNQEQIRIGFRHREGDFVGVSWLPVYHDMGLIGMVLQPLYVGGDCVLMSPADFLQDPYVWLAAISSFGGTTSGAPNFAYDLCARKIADERMEALSLDSWDVAFCGAEPVRAGTLDRFAARFASCGFRRAAWVPCYGLAEASLLVSGASRDQEPTVVQIVPSGERNARALVGCGPIVGEQEVAIVNSKGIPVQPGEVGEIWLRGGNVGAGYWGRPDASRETFEGQLSGDPARQYLRTGDLGFVDEAGELFPVGRIKDLIIVRGVNFYPQDIEAAAEQSWPGFRPGCSAAFALDHEDTEGAILICEHDDRDHVPVEWGAVADTVRAAIGEEYGLGLERVVIVRRGQVPKTSSGKVRRYLASARYLAGELDVIHEWRSARPDEPPPVRKPVLLDGRLEIEAFIMDWLSARLQRAIAADDEFSNLGLDSLDLAMLVGDLCDHTGRELRPRVALDFPSPSALAAHLARPVP